jgi:4-amino-4-deoxy-L-arabinose transferase-like glycosyltransferase
MLLARFAERLESPRSLGRLVFALAAIALTARVAVLVAFWPTWIWHSGHIQDDWNKLAINWVVSGTFGFTPGEPTVQRGPIFPVFEIPLYLLFGENYACWSISLLALDACTSVFLLLLGRRLWGTRAAFFAALFHAVYLPVIYYTAIINQFTAVLPLVVLWFYLISSWDLRTSAKPHYVVLGLVGGILILSKVVYLPVVVGTIAALLWFRRKEHDAWIALKHAAIVLLIAAAVVAPWTYRNYVVTNGAFIPVQSLFWEGIWQKFTIRELDAREGLNRPPGRTLEYYLGRQQELMRSLGEDRVAHLTGPQRELYRERVFRGEVLERLRQNPTAYAFNIASNAWYFWVGAENLTKTLVMTAMQIPFLGTSLFGLFLAARYGKIYKLRLGLILILILWAEHCVVFSWGRYSLDTAPVLALTFGTGLDAWLRRNEGRAAIAS